MSARNYDLVIVGAGSGNMLPTEEFAGWRIAVAESSSFGGTCLNRGCVPSKMLVHTADVTRAVRRAGRFGIGAEWTGADWPAIRDRVFGRIDPLHEQAAAYRRAGGIDVFPGEARFTGPNVLRVGDDELHADRFVLATGSRPFIPAVPGLAGVPYLTSDTVMRLDALPESMAVLGGGTSRPRWATFSPRSAPMSLSCRAASTCFRGTTSTSGRASPNNAPSASTCACARQLMRYRRPAPGSTSTSQRHPAARPPRPRCCWWRLGGSRIATASAWRRLGSRSMLTAMSAPTTPKPRARGGSGRSAT
jgi:hypothetical protein